MYTQKRLFDLTASICIVFSSLAKAIRQDKKVNMYYKGKKQKSYLKIKGSYLENGK